MDSVEVKDKVLLNQNPDDRCSDYDSECIEVSCKLSCWLYAPELGVCPFLIEGGKGIEY